MQGTQPPPELLAYKALQAVQRGNAEELAKLIQAGANAHVINAVVKTGTSPNGRPDREAKGGLLYHAVDKQNVELVKVLLGNGAEVNGSKQDESPPPLRAAVFRKNIELVTLLLKRGANVNGKYAISTGSTKITMTVLFESTSDAIYNLLLRRGGDVNVKNSNGDTPLHVHAAQWKANFVNELVEHGADVNALDKENRTPLLRAIQQSEFPPGCDEEEDFIDVCHILMSHKATLPSISTGSNKPEDSERLRTRLHLVKEWAVQRDVGMVALTHVPLEIYQRGIAEMTAYFASNTLVPVVVEQSDLQTETHPETPRRQSNAGVAAWSPGEEVLQRQVEILPALDRAPSLLGHAPTRDDVSPFPGRPLVDDPKPALPPVSTRTGIPPVPALQLYRLKIMCATGLRRVLKYRRQNPYCICRLVRSDGEVLLQVETSVHPGGGQAPTWRGQVFELALTPEDTRICTLVFTLKHSGVVASLDERIAVGMMPFPYLPIGHSLTHKLLLMNNDNLAGRLEIHLESF
ncbi:Ankyrin repeat domain containing hypothetical protein [Phytophthora palmivora]|uniref:Uncharacterized protein n=1 Tax=Phytophthora palmivora TaxID=4796 RepID=A0A2P4X1X1_9STRA|nr:Ankyrin repeat domain containing hypothetical protein [Phytophthora palmivora]